jgi:hypothetical protein
VLVRISFEDFAPHSLPAIWNDFDDMVSHEEKGVFEHGAQSDVSETFDLEKDASALRTRRK